MITTHKIESLSFDNEYMYLKSSDNVYRIKLKLVSSKVEAADDFQREVYTISPSGYGINWPLIDEDLSIDLLLNLAEDC
jgi:hypothetical protein